MEKIPLGIEITSINEVTYKIKDNSIMPNRTIKEYWTFDGKLVGTYDPLDEFALIKSSATFEEYSKDR